MGSIPVRSDNSPQYIERVSPAKSRAFYRLEKSMPITEQQLLQILPNAGRQAGNKKGTDLFNYSENKSVPFVEVKPKNGAAPNGRHSQE